MTRSRGRAGRAVWILFAGVALFFVVFVVWADRAEIDQMARGPAEVVPAREIQTISHLEGGILEALTVREGETVKAGQTVARIKNTQTRADFEAARVRKASLTARRQRLQAEIAGEPVSFPARLRAESPEHVAAQRRLAATRRDALDARLTVLDLRRRETRQELEVQRLKAGHLRQRLRIAREEVDILAPLVEEGAAARTDLLAVRKTISDLKSELNSVETAIPKTESKLEEIETERATARAEFRSGALERLNATRDELARVKQRITAGTQRLERTSLEAPTDGVVQSVPIPTIGGVVEPGETILEIVPTTETLLVEARIKPEDVAFIRPGQEASVKISAYDYAVYGGLEGEVTAISADTLVDERTDERYYRVTVRTEDNAIAHEGERFLIRPGMTGSVDILTGKKTILEIALSPLKTLAERALRER
jgi:adhesin transport system membrane fusion protein